MPNYISHCPGCASAESDIGWAGSYFDVYECAGCRHRYCHKCRGSNNGRQCPSCGNDESSTYGRVAKS
jgi:RNA polymerase subunit RPABC4/transcription elongation factor Spt4